MYSSSQPLKIIRCFPGLPIPVVTLSRTAAAIYKSEHIPLSRRISLVFCSDRAIRRLNGRYRNIDRATDVLSFPFGDDDFLGEIYLSPYRASVQAREFGLTYRQEIVRLFIHGCYHLLGYDHKTKRGNRMMEKKENKVLKQFADM